MTERNNFHGDRLGRGLRRSEGFSMTIVSFERHIASGNGSFIPPKETAVMSWEEEEFRQTHSDNSNPLISH